MLLIELLVDAYWEFVLLLLILISLLMSEKKNVELQGLASTENKK